MAMRILIPLFLVAYLPLVQALQSSALTDLIPRFVASTAVSASYQQYAPQAVQLFNNVKSPASLLISGLVPLALTAALPITPPEDKEEGRFKKVLRRLYSVVGISALMSEFLAIVWASVTVNQLIESPVEPARSVWHLISRDLELQWTGVNVHFLLGMLGFGFLVGVRAFFSAGSGVLGKGIGGIAVSALMLMISVVNRGVSSGGEGDHGYGNIFGLVRRHFYLLAMKAMKSRPIGKMDVLALALLTVSLLATLWASGKDDCVEDDK